MSQTRNTRHHYISKKTYPSKENVYLSFARAPVAAAAIMCFLALTIRSPLHAVTSDMKMYRIIRAYQQKGSGEDAGKLARQFLRDHPMSGLVPDVRLVIAETETDHEKALTEFRIVRDKYRYYKRRDYAQYCICEILYMTSRWHDLYDESSQGIKLFKSSPHEDDFLYLRAIALVQLDRLDEAEKDCHRVIEKNHTYNDIARTLLLLSHITKRRSGYSREYIYTLRETALGFERAEITPSTLYLLGKFYESRNDIDHAWSAYSDVVERFPQAPEANFSKRRIAILKNKKPRRVKYLPDEKTVKETETINIQPEIPLPEQKETVQDHFYSLSIGPFSSYDEARRIKNIINDFGVVKTARLRQQYTLYLGSYRSTEGALKTKIRLAEEIGINANIVRVSGRSGMQYIYGE